MSHRHQQIESTLKRALQQVLARGLADPRADGSMITVTGIRVAPDLKNATVMVSILPEKKQDLVMHALRHAAAHIRRQVGDEVAMKQMPQLAFDLDTSLKKAGEVIDALARVAAEREARSAARGGADPGAAGPGAGNNAPGTPEAHGS